MIARRIFVAAIPLAFPPTPAMTQTPQRVAQVGLVGLGISTQLRATMREVLRANGFEEGHNLIIHERSAGSEYERLQANVRELVELGVNVIYAGGETGAQAARAATTVVPIVTISGGDPVASGHATSLARPGGNVTGYWTLGEDLLPKRLEILASTMIGSARVGVIYSPVSPQQVRSVRSAQSAASSLGLDLLIREIHTVTDIEPSLASLAAAGADAFATVSSSLLLTNAALVVEVVKRLRRPAIYNGRRFVEAGGLMSYGINLTLPTRGAAEYIVRILKGEKAGDLPFQQVDRFELVINLRTARELGLALPASLLDRADELIE